MLDYVHVINFLLLLHLTIITNALPDEVWMCQKVALQLLNLLHVVIKFGH